MNGYRYISTIAVYALLVLLALGCNRSKKRDNDLKEMGLYGKVRSVQVKKFKAYQKFGEPVKGEQTDEEVRITFNKKGNKTEKCHYTPEGELHSMHTYTYDDAHRLIEEKAEYPEGSIRYEYYYDEDGHLVKMLEYDERGAFSIKHKYRYDKDGHRAEENIYKADDGFHMGKKVFFYDRDGRREKELNFLNDSEKEYIEKSFKYSVKGHVIEVLRTHVQEKRYESMRTWISKVKYTYNDKGHKTDKRIWRDDEHVEHHYTFTYSYDQQGNWIVKKTMKVDVPVSIQERKISYHE